MYGTLGRYGKIVVFIVSIVGMFLVAMLSFGRNISEKQAGIICAKLVYENVTQQFAIMEVKYEDFYTLTNSRVRLYVEFANNNKYYMNCIYKRKYKENTIIMEKAELRSTEGKEFILTDIKVYYEDR